MKVLEASHKPSFFLKIMSQYFENDYNIQSNIREIKYTYYKKEIKFKVDNGIFSKDRVDFGTNLLLQSLPIFANETILDMGCGYGTIGIAIAKAFEMVTVNMCDVNTRAIELTKRNIILNNLKNATCFESDCYTNVDNKYDVIISNPPIRAGKKVVHEIALKATLYLNEKGKAYFVIQKKQGAESLLKAMQGCYKECNVINKKNGYLIIEGIK